MKIVLNMISLRKATFLNMFGLHGQAIETVDVNARRTELAARASITWKGGSVLAELEIRPTCCFLAVARG